ncbi:hypothetical protein MG293_015880 [Ovis ammon polii]|uniref:Protein FAM32A n=1 Tax=Ovis ammon polii TaxID=230172 RepID=A0AAD4TZN1_OVIAM|nr:hypothetical protein MG293_015880 [Ovis ammon polii]
MGCELGDEAEGPEGLATVVRVQGEDFLMPVSDVEMLGFEVSEGHDEGGGAREPQSTVSVVPPDEGQQESQDGQHLPGVKDLSMGPGQKAFPPETIPETGELEGQMPSQENLEKDLLEDTGVTRTLPSQEPELVQDGEGDISTTSGSRRGPLKNRRQVLRRRDRSPTCQDERPEAATCLEQGELSGQQSGVQSCKDLEDVLRNKQKPKKWTIVCIQGQKYLVRDPDTEVVEAKASDMDDDRDPCGEPQPLVRVIPPEDGLEGSQELQNLPGAADLSREPARQWKQGEESQDQRALPPETVPESGEPEGQTPRENLEKDLLEDRGETKTLQSQEPELLKGPDMAKEKGTAVPLAKTCVNKQPRVWTKESFQDSLGPIPLLHLAPWDPPVFLREQKPRDGHPVNAGNPNPKMGSMDTYEQVQKGPLKLKGGPELGVTKRKKKKDRDKAKLLQMMGKIQKNQEEELRRHLDKRTPAQVAFEKVQEKRQMERVLKKASITHKQRVEDFNRHLDTLSEHYDIPKVSWTK